MAKHQKVDKIYHKTARGDSVMGFSIGLRVYQVSIHDVKNRESLTFTNDGGVADAYSFLSDFVNEYSNASDHEDLQRSWFLQKKSGLAVNNIYGYVRYGTYGFESDLIDRKTMKKNYTRKVGDLEEIPLYFHFWLPAKQDFGLVAFQSFQARSCIQIVTNAASESYRKQNKAYRLSFKKLLPGDVLSSALYSSPVKQFTLIKKRLPADKEDRYLLEFNPESRSGKFFILNRAFAA